MARGYGLTLGVSLRRILLSSLPGAAITSVWVSGIPHEFMAIPGAKEDMTLLLLNLKRVRLISYSDEPVRLRVSARGKSVVTAGDIECPADVEIVNPEFRLLTLDTLDSDLEMEMTVERGVGYSPAEERRNLPIGQIPVDAIFSPVIKVSNRVEPARIEQITNYDLLRMEIWTDGTLSPTDALTQAAEILIEHLRPVAEFSSAGKLGVASVRQKMIAPEYYDVPIEDLDLSMRSFNCLKRAGISTVGEVLERMERGVEEMLAIRNFGQKSLAELVESLQTRGYLPKDFDFS